MTILRTAYVYVRNIFAGQLCESDEGYTFTYDKAYLESKNASAVSLTLPLSKEAYSSKTLFSFFDGLIPEGWLLDVVSRNWKSITGTDSVCYWLPARIVSVMLQLWRKNYEMSVLWKRY